MSFDFGNSDFMFFGARKTRVVNLKHNPLDADIVYIGRAGQGQDGYFGNPIRRGRACPVCKTIHILPSATLTCYRVYLFDRLARDPEFKRRVEGLRGKVLGCFCKPKPCHGDILVEYLERQ